MFEHSCTSQVHDFVESILSELVHVEVYVEMVLATEVAQRGATEVAQRGAKEVAQR